MMFSNKQKIQYLVGNANKTHTFKTSEFLDYFSKELLKDLLSLNFRS